MIIFTSPDLKPRVEAIRNGKPTTVIVIDIKKKFRYIRSRIEKFKKMSRLQIDLSLDN
ncbi:lipopolysaccharide biosynthesis protein [Escherichia coli DEC8B]|nr:lipopolysaccharide biosynthesis protein [Escherichia coli DEC8B]